MLSGGTSWCAVVTVVCFGACSETTSPQGDSSVTTDRGVQTDQAVGVDQGEKQDQGQQADQGEFSFDYPVTLRHDTGLPVAALISFSDVTAQTRYDVPEGMLPFALQAVEFVPASAHVVIVSVHRDAGDSPGTELAKQEVGIGADDVGRWYSVDFTDADAVVAQGPIWVVQKYKPTLPDATEVAYGAPDTTGHTAVVRPPFTTISTNFEPLMRVKGATTQQQGSNPPGQIGNACRVALDCESGYCSGGVCSNACPQQTECGSGRACREMAYGDKICVTSCATDADCEATAQCLTDDRVFTAGFCVLRGPRANGGPCNYQFHTICQSGHCSACDADANCNALGTCEPKDSP